MPTPPPANSDARKRLDKENLRKRYLYLTISGVVSLILPLLGIAYLRMSDNLQPIRKNQVSAVFSRRAGDPLAKKKILPAKTSAAPLPNPLTVEVIKTSSQPAPKQPEGGLTQDSLSFIRGGGEYYKEKKPAPAAAAAQEAAKPAAKKTPAKPAKKLFVAPKLKGNTRFSDFKGKQSLLKDLPQDTLQETPDMDAIMKKASEGN